MASFTSSTSGDWNVSATWGKSGSPPVKGTDYPGVAGDTFTVSAGHTVNYNVSETNELGASTIAGLLSFAINANTLLTFAHVDLTISNGGELRIGTTGAIVDKSYTAQLLWNTTADNAKGLVIAAGGKFTAAGDPTFYGSVESTTLASNWTSGNTITTTDDMKGVWAVGQEILIHKNALYSNWLTDTVPALIASFGADGSKQINLTFVGGGTTFPGGTFVAGGYVGLVTRNVKIQKYGVDADPIKINNAGSLYAFSNRPRISDSNTSGTNFNVSNVLFTGIVRIQAGFQQIFTNCVCRFGAITFLTNLALRYNNGLIYGMASYCYQSVTSFVSSAIHIANSGILYTSTLGLITGDCFGNQNLNGAAAASKGIEVIGDVYSNRYVMPGGAGINLNGKVFYNDYICPNSANITQNSVYKGQIGWNKSDSSSPNNYDFTFNTSTEVLLDNVKVPNAGFNLTGRNTSYYNGRLKCKNYNQTLNDDRIIDCFGTILRKTAGGSEPTARTSSNDQILKCSSETNCSAINPLLIINPDKHRYYCEADVQKTIRYYFQLDGTASEIVDGNRLTGVNGVTLELSWLDGTTNSSRTTTISTNHIQPRTSVSDWSQYIEATVIPQVTGYIYAAVYLMVDIGVGKYLWCDPLGKEIAEVPLSYSLIWTDGETQIAQMDQTVPWLVADAVWDEVKADHTVAGSFGQAANNLDDTISSRASQTSLNALNNLSQNDIIEASWGKVEINRETGEFTAYGMDGVTVVASGTIDVGIISGRTPT